MIDQFFYSSTNSLLKAQNISKNFGNGKKRERKGKEKATKSKSDGSEGNILSEEDNHIQYSAVRATSLGMITAALT